jgi:hypothetical protein
MTGPKNRPGIKVGIVLTINNYFRMPKQISKARVASLATGKKTAASAKATADRANPGTPWRG